MITTKIPLAAKFLHQTINHGEKCKLSKSVLVKQYNGKPYTYAPRKFVFNEHFEGFLWDQDSKTDLLSRISPKIPKKEIFELVGGNQDKSIRHCYKLVDEKDICLAGTNVNPAQTNSLIQDSTGCGASLSCTCMRKASNDFNDQVRKTQWGHS